MATAPELAIEDGELLSHAGFGLAERRRSRTYQPLGYNGLPVLKTAEFWVWETDRGW